MTGAEITSKTSVTLSGIEYVVCRNEFGGVLHIIAKWQSKNGKRLNATAIKTDSPTARRVIAAAA